MDLKATMQALLDKAIILTLLGIFISRVAISVMRMEEGEVGIAQRKMKSNKLQYPDVTFCFHTWYENSSHNFAKNSGHVPKLGPVMNITDILITLYFHGYINDR